MPPTLALSAKVPCKHVSCIGAERRIVAQFSVGSLKFTKLECGHSFNEPGSAVTSAKMLRDYTWNGGKHLFDPFQIETIQRTERSDISFLNLNEMGLGKMVTSVATLNFHPEILPALWVCKSRLRRQTFEHLVRMSETDMPCPIPGDHKGCVVCGGEGSFRRPKLLPEILEGGNAIPHSDIFNVTIVSYDTLWRIVMKSVEAQKEMAKELFEEGELDLAKIPEALGKILASGPFRHFKTIICDEFQMMKNPGAKRTKAIRIISRDIKHKIGCSGTPTKNNGEEYFVPLNWVRPDLFPSFTKFCEEWIEYMFSSTGVQKPLGIKPSKRKEWDRLIEPFTVRYTRLEVMPNLPPIFRQHEYIDLAGKVKEAYKKELKGFEDAYLKWESLESAKDKAAQWGVVNDALMKLKRIVGLAKADWLVQEDGWLEEFLGQTDRKIVIAHHHIEAGIIVASATSALCKRVFEETGKFVPEPIHLHGGLSEDAMWKEIGRFKSQPELRVMIIRQLAEGEGLNLQECGDLVQLERQWNPANEEQVEARFPRPGTTYAKINVLYPVALGTVDEFLASTVERKRYAAENTYGKGTAVHWTQTNVLQDVAKQLFEKGLKPWGSV